MLPHVAGVLLCASRLDPMSENTETPEGERHRIDYVLQTPQTIEDATTTRATLQQIAKLLGYDPDTVASVTIEPMQVTILTITKVDGRMVKREGTTVYEGRKHVRIVI